MCRVSMQVNKRKRKHAVDYGSIFTILEFQKSEVPNGAHGAKIKGSASRAEFLGRLWRRMHLHVFSSI